MNNKKRIGMVSLLASISFVVGQLYAGTPFPSPPLPLPPTNLEIVYVKPLEGNPDYTHIIGLGWDGNVEPLGWDDESTLLGYNVYEKAFNHGPPVKCVTFTGESKMDNIFINMDEFTHYHWWVTTVDKYGQESKKSKVVRYPNGNKKMSVMAVAESKTMLANLACLVSPNPVRSMAHIKYQIADNSFVSLVVYDVDGRLIEKLINKRMESGNYSAEWITENLKNGIYFINLRAGGLTRTIKVVLVR